MTAYQASLASQHRARQLNAYWDRVYWLLDTTRRDWM